jgi:hypothetical protein
MPWQKPSFLTSPYTPAGAQTAEAFVALRLISKKNAFLGRVKKSALNTT